MRIVRSPDFLNSDACRGHVQQTIDSIGLEILGIPNAHRSKGGGGEAFLTILEGCIEFDTPIFGPDSFGGKAASARARQPSGSQAAAPLLNGRTRSIEAEPGSR